MYTLLGRQQGFITPAPPQHRPAGRGASPCPARPVLRQNGQNASVGDMKRRYAGGRCEVRRRRGPLAFLRSPRPGSGVRDEKGGDLVREQDCDVSVNGKIEEHGTPKVYFCVYMFENDVETFYFMPNGFVGRTRHLFRRDLCGAA